MTTLFPSESLKTFISNFDDLFNTEALTPEKDFELELPYPGLSKEDLHLDYEGDVLSVSVQKKELNGYLKNYLNQRRTYRFSTKYDLSKVEAKMEHGLLKLHVPLKTTSFTRIPIQLN